MYCKHNESSIDLLTEVNLLEVLINHAPNTQGDAVYV